MSLELPTEIRLVEVGLRDGLQVVQKTLATRDKLTLVESLLASGIRHIEAVSFAHPKTLPQLADAEQLMALVPRNVGAVYRGLVPNLHGAHRAAECGLDQIVALTCTDETVTQVNQNRAVSEVLNELSSIGEVAHAAGAQLIVGVAMAFFAPGRGAVPADERNRCIDAAIDAGASGIYLGGSSGMDDPRQIADGVSDLKRRHPRVEIGVHLHARNGMALANALTAMDSGVDWLEGAFGGLGGDLWAPGKKEVLGNVPLEDLVHMSDCLGIKTGIDLDAYLQVVNEASQLTDWEPRSAVVAGGTRSELARFDWKHVSHAEHHLTNRTETI